MAESVVTAESTSVILPGLENLNGVTHLFVRQQVEVTEVLTGFETKNKYDIINTRGEVLFFAVETTNCCLVCCSRTSRPFKFKILDHVGKTVMKVERPCSCTSCCGCRLCCCGLFEDSRVNVTLADGTLLGQVVESCHPFSPRYYVKNQNMVKKLKIKGPGWAFCCTCKLMGNVEFQIKSLEGEKENCGKISKKFEGFERGANVPTSTGDADNYGVCFPVEMDIRMKATLLGAVLLIDFMFFENDEKKMKPRGIGD